MKNEKGVALITLSITIAVLIILTFALSINMGEYQEKKKKANFETDIRSLKEEIDQYYARKDTLPIINKFVSTSMLNGIKNINDNDKYYVIDISKLEVNLNYGTDYYTIKNKPLNTEITNLLDVYIINEQSHTIYYPKGIGYSGKIYYRLSEVFSEISYNQISE